MSLIISSKLFLFPVTLNWEWCTHTKTPHTDGLCQIIQSAVMLHVIMMKKYIHAMFASIHAASWNTFLNMIQCVFIPLLQISLSIVIELWGFLKIINTHMPQKCPFFVCMSLFFGRWQLLCICFLCNVMMLLPLIVLHGICVLVHFCVISGCDCDSDCVFDSFVFFCLSAKQISQWQ